MIRIAVTALMTLTLLQCSTYFNFFGEKSTFFNKSDIIILEKTIKSIEFDYGYDPDLDLDYIFPLYEGFNKFKDDSSSFSAALNDIKKNDLMDYHQKMYRLQKLTQKKLEYYQRTGKWNHYTYIQKYILPSLNHYMELLDKQVQARSGGYHDVINKRKKVIDQEIKKEMDKKEFEEIWENDYNT